MEAYEGQERVIAHLPPVLATVATLLAGTRLSLTWKRRGTIGMEEVMVICADLSLIATAVTLNQGARWGFGRHKADIIKHGGDLKLAMTYFYLTQIIYKVTITFTKLSFCFLYKRIFDIPQFRRIIWTTLLIVASGGCAFVLATIFQCTPVQSYIDRTIPGTCINNSAFRWSWATFTLVTDLWIFFLPLPVIKNLHTNLATKIGLSMIFLLGLFVCVTTAFRMKAMVQSTHAVDIPWDSGPAYIWSFTEAAVGLIISCLPSLKQPLGKCFPRLLSTRTRKTAGYRDNSYKLSPYGQGSSAKKSALTSDRDHRISARPDKKAGEVTVTALGDINERSESMEKILGISVQREVSVRSSPASLSDFSKEP